VVVCVASDGKVKVKIDVFAGLDGNADNEESLPTALSKSTDCLAYYPSRLQEDKTMTLL